MAERTSSPLDPVSVLRDQERQMTDGRIANGDRVIFQGAEYCVTAVACGGRDGSQVRLDTVDRDVRQWVDTALVERAA